MRYRVLLICLLALLIPPDTHAASRAKRCRVACRDAVLVCVARIAEVELAPDLGGRARRRALRQLRRRCRGGLLARCRQDFSACLPTTTTTVTTTTTTSTTVTTTTTTSTTTTTLPDPLVGDWHFSGEGSENCSAFEPHVEVSFHLERFGTTLSGSWFLDEPAPGLGTVLGPDVFRFALRGSARHHFCTITSLTLRAEEVGGDARATLTATAFCQGRECGGEWMGPLEKRPAPRE